MHTNAYGFPADADRLCVLHDDVLIDRPRIEQAASGGAAVVILRQDGTRTDIPVDQANRFDVFRTRDIGVARGDRIRITKNGESKVAGRPKARG